jgi:autotransporter-associated beta strand protein
VVWTPGSGAAGTMRLFLNGNATGQASFTAGFKQNLPILFGGIRTGAPDPRHFDGWLDDCALYRAALDDAEIARLAAMPVVHNAGRESTGAVQVQVSTFAAGLSGHWPFDGSYDDASGNGRHLTPGGSTTLSGSPVKQGSAAMQATVSGSYASTAGAVPLGNEFTLAAWIYLPAGTTTIRTIAANSASGANTSGFRFFANSFNTADGKLLFETGNGSLSARISSAVDTLAFDRWQHVAATVNRSAGTATLYRNGTPVASGPIRTDFSNSAILHAAAMSGTNFSLRGTLDDLRLYSRILGAEEMHALAAVNNAAPTITGPASFSHPAGSPASALAVTIGDEETPAAQLVLSAVSSDPLLLPPSAITPGGTGENRTLVLTPVAWRGGTATVTLSVDDGLAISQTSFVLTVTNPGYPALWTAVLPDADLPWSVPAHWDASITPWPGMACDLDFLTNITVPAGEIIAVQDMAEPFTARRVLLGGSGPASGNARLTQQGGALALVADGSGTPALELNAIGALEHRIEAPVSIASNLNISGDGGGGFEIAGNLSGAAGLVKSGTATLVLSGNNNYSGNTNIQQGAIRAAHASALGSTANGATIQGGTARASLELTGEASIAEPIQLVMHNNTDHTQLRNHSGDNTLTGQLSLNSGGGRWDIASLAGSLTLAGPLVNISTGTDTWRTLHLHGPASGAITGNLTNSASGNSLTNLHIVSGNWTLSGNAKSYTGSSIVDGGSLEIQTSLASSITVNANATLRGSGSTTGSLTLQNNARLFTRITDWDAPPAPFTAASLTLTGASAIDIVADGAALDNFTESPRSFAILTTDSAPQPGTTQFQVTAQDFPGPGTWSAALSGNELRLTYQPDLYAAWTAGIDWHGRDSSPLADPENDGLVNLLEYALAGDPLASDPGILPQPSLSNHRLALTFQRIADPDLIYQVQASENLAEPWQTVWSSTGGQNTAGQVAVEDIQTITGHPRRFMRLRVSR